MVCAKCGKEIKQGDRFCSACGNKIEWNSDIDCRETEKQKDASEKIDNDAPEGQIDRGQVKVLLLSEKSKTLLKKIGATIVAVAIFVSIILGTIVLVTVSTYPQLLDFRKEVRNGHYEKANSIYYKFSDEERAFANEWLRITGREGLIYWFN